MNENLLSLSSSQPQPQQSHLPIPNDIDHYSSASCISRLVFHWAYKIIRYSHHNKLTASSLGTITGNLSSKNFMNRTYYVYNTLNYKSKPKNSLILTILRANIWRVFAVFFLGLITTGLNVLAMNLFRKYIQLFSLRELNPSSITDIDFIFIGASFLCVKFINIFLLKQTNECQNIIGFKSGVELNCLIFDKLLQYSPASRKLKAESGEILNFVQVDSHKVTRMMLLSPNLVTIPIMLIAYSYMLFVFLGWQFIFGLLTLLLFIVINFYFQQQFKKHQKQNQKNIDKRLRITSETLFNLKVLKLYAWDEYFLNKIKEARENEMKELYKIFNITNFNRTLLWFSPIATAIVTIGTYQYLTSSIKIEDIFTCLGILSSIQEPVRSLSTIYTNAIETLISLKRIENFLKQDDVDPNKIQRNEQDSNSEGIAVKIENGNFSWGVEQREEKPQTYLPLQKSRNDTKKSKSIYNSNNKHYNQFQSIEVFPLLLPNTLKNINLTVNKGEFICIIGEVGSGKSSLLYAILNNLIQLPGKNGELTKLIVNGSIAYVSQTPWIQNETLRNNILFHETYNEHKYNEILKISELESDLEILQGGDLTEIGEKGINLSGGQKARISIARALYSEADIYLFDDPISALDANVGKNIIHNCICDYLKGKTRLLVTHAIQYAHLADRIVYIKEGEIEWIGKSDEMKKQSFYVSLMTSGKKSRSGNNEISFVVRDEDIDEHSNSDSDDNNVDVDEIEDEPEDMPKQVKRITREEDKVEGKLGKNVFKTYIQNNGGKTFLVLLVVLLIIWQTLKCGSDLWIAYWNKQVSNSFSSYYFTIYAGLGLGSTLFVFFRLLLIAKGSLSNSRELHNKMVTCLVHAPINLYHDTVPKGQILNRLSKDLDNLDYLSNLVFNNTVTYGMNLLGEIIICAIFQPYCLILVPIIFLLGMIIMNYYLHCSRELSRIQGIVRSPMINSVNETIFGSITIRAYNKQEIFINTFRKYVDEYLKSRLFINGTMNWYILLLDLLSFSFICFLVVFTIIFKQNFEVQVIGIILTYCVQLQGELVRFLVARSNLENDMIAQERCLSYTSIQSECPSNKGNDNTKYESWPYNGKIEFKNFTVQYRPDSEIVLNDISFSIHQGEKIGIAGRTGSGKSTIALCMFRILEAKSGSILIDDVDISEIGLYKLRSSITIIPQDPALMEGSLRFNIDPLKLYSDDEIEEVMRQIGFWYICEQEQEDIETRGLDMLITENGANISIGEKQLICIARAILRKSKIVIMDEATSCIDLKTENLIQKAISELLSDSTIITIAHRIKTIIKSDRILVLDQGRIAEYDTPSNLMNNKDSLFYELYSKSH